jgi:hypothetical protein
MTKVNSELYGEIESIKAPFKLEHGELTYTQAKELARYTKYGEPDADGEQWVSGGVALGSFNDVIEMSDVTTFEKFKSYVLEFLDDGWGDQVKIEGEKIYYGVYE